MKESSKSFEEIGREAWIGLGKFIAYAVVIVGSIAAGWFLWGCCAWGRILIDGLGNIVLSLGAFVVLTTVVAMIWSVVAPITRWWKRRSMGS